MHNGGLDVRLCLRHIGHRGLHLGFRQLHVDIPHVIQTEQTATGPVQHLRGVFNLQAPLVAFHHGRRLFLVELLVPVRVNPVGRKGRLEARNLRLLSGKIALPRAGLRHRQTALRHRHSGVEIAHCFLQPAVAVEDCHDLPGSHQVSLMDFEFANNRRLARYRPRRDRNDAVFGLDAAQTRDPGGPLNFRRRPGNRFGPAQQAVVI